MFREDPSTYSLTIFEENLKVTQGKGLYFSKVHESLWSKRTDLKTEEKYIFSVAKNDLIKKALHCQHLVVHPYQAFGTLNREEQ